MTDRESSRDKGRQAEELACAHLRRQGFATLGKNWTCRRGELDLVMLDGDTVVFVEVRSRRHRAWGGALESIDARKRQRRRSGDLLGRRGLSRRQHVDEWLQCLCSPLLNTG